MTPAAQSALRQLMVQSRDLVDVRDRFKAETDEDEKRILMEIYLVQWKEFVRCLEAAERHI